MLSAQVFVEVRVVEQDVFDAPLHLGRIERLCAHGGMLHRQSTQHLREKVAGDLLDTRVRSLRSGIDLRTDVARRLR